MRPFAGHEKRIIGAKELPNGNGNIVSYSDDKTMLLWNGRSGTLLKTFNADTNTVVKISILDENRFLSYSDAGSMYIWSYTGELLASLLGHSSYITCFAIVMDTEKDSSQILSGSADGTIR